MFYISSNFLEQDDSVGIVKISYSHELQKFMKLTSKEKRELIHILERYIDFLDSRDKQEEGTSESKRNRVIKV